MSTKNNALNQIARTNKFCGQDKIIIGATAMIQAFGYFRLSNFILTNINFLLTTSADHQEYENY